MLMPYPTVAESTEGSEVWKTVRQGRETLWSLETRDEMEKRLRPFRYALDTEEHLLPV
jgi:hypothetical protein